MCKCCMSGNMNIRQAVPRQCRADQLISNCDCGANDTCSCQVLSGPFTYGFSSLRSNRSDCNCAQITQGNITTSQCQCCQPRAVLNLTAPVCDINTTTSQQCSCRNVFNSSTNITSQVCDCNRTVAGKVETRKDVELRVDRQCSCLNQTFNGVNSLNCTCCVPNPPPTICQRLSAPRANSLGCTCRDIIIDGKAV